MVLRYLIENQRIYLIVYSQEKQLTISKPVISTTQDYSVDGNVYFLQPRSIQPNMDYITRKVLKRRLQ